MKTIIQIPLNVWMEDDLYVAYTPALELSTCAKSEKELLEVYFPEAVQCFLEAAAQDDRLDDILLELGWTKVENSWIPHARPAPSERSFPLSIPENQHPH